MTRRSLLALPLAAPLLPAKPRPDSWRPWLAAAQVPTLTVIDVAAGKPPLFEFAHTAEAPTSDSIYAAASLSKQITAALVLDLVDRKKLTLDQPLGDIAEIPGQPGASRATARMLLSHRSGFPNWRGEPGDKLVVLDKAAWRYSGEGYVYLQRVIEKLTGRPFARHAQQTLFEKLGMSRTSFAPSAGPPHARPHNSRGETPPNWQRRRDTRLDAAAGRVKHLEDLTIPMQEEILAAQKEPPLPNWFVINAAASLETTPADYARFLAFALAKSIPAGFEVEIVRDAAFTLGWGLGWGLEKQGSRVYAWQWGNNSGYKHFVQADLTARRAIAVFTNGDNGEAVYQRAFRAYTGRDAYAFLRL